MKYYPNVENSKRNKTQESKTILPYSSEVFEKAQVMPDQDSGAFSKVTV